MSKLEYYIRKIVEGIEESSLIATVVSVEDNTCTIKTKLSDIEIPNVRLNAQKDTDEGIVIKPKKGSDVLLGALSDRDLYIAMFSEIDSIAIKIGDISCEIDKNSIVLNGNQANSYLVDINKLKGKLNKLEQEFNTLKTTLTAWVPVPTDGGAVLKSALTTWASQMLTPTTVNEIADNKIKH